MDSYRKLVRLCVGAELHTNQIQFKISLISLSELKQMQSLAEIWIFGQGKPIDSCEFNWRNAVPVLRDRILAFYHEQTFHMSAIV